MNIHNCWWSFFCCCRKSLKHLQCNSQWFLFLYNFHRFIRNEVFIKFSANYWRCLNNYLMKHNQIEKQMYGYSSMSRYAFIYEFTSFVMNVIIVIITTGTGPLNKISTFETRWPNCRSLFALLLMSMIWWCISVLLYWSFVELIAFKTSWQYLVCVVL